MIVNLLFLGAFYALLWYGFSIERVHPGAASKFLPMWGWMAMTVISLPAALVSLKSGNRTMKIADNVHSAVGELERRQAIRGFDGLVLLASKLLYGGMAIWCVVFLYYNFAHYKFAAAYPVIAGIILTNLAYSTLVQLVVWSAIRRTSVTIDDLYEQIPKSGD